MTAQVGLSPEERARSEKSLVGALAHLVKIATKGGKGGDCKALLSAVLLLLPPEVEGLTHNDCCKCYRHCNHVLVEDAELNMWSLEQARAELTRQLEEVRRQQSLSAMEVSGV